MHKFEEIKQKINALRPVFETEEVVLKDALNRILQEDVMADMDMPPFNKSAVDGYACHSEDLGNSLEVLEVIQAGSISTRNIGKNQCVKIMTGAAVPIGCDTVFMVEDAVTEENNRVRCTNPKTKKNICYRGEDYQTGEILIRKGTIIQVSQLAVLAGAGKSTVKVTKKPRVSIITTGSELVEPEITPSAGKIRNSNASQLIAQLQKMNLGVNYLGLVEDDFDKLSKTFSEALDNSDIVFFTGGASVGDFDFVPELLRQNGFEILWDRTGMKPGNPMTLSKKGKKYCFGLSGNPVSSLVQFELIAKPALYKLLGADFAPLRLKARLATDFVRNGSGRLGVFPVMINSEGEIEQLPFHGSAHINALVYANALMEIAPDIVQLKKGDFAYVRPL